MLLVRWGDLGEIKSGDKCRLALTWGHAMKDSCGVGLEYQSFDSNLGILSHNITE